MSIERITLGKQGEEIAIKYLKKKGYKIIERNYRSKLGEIDIVASQKGTTVFVEVKTRRGQGFGLPCEAVDENKQRKMAKIALGYIQHRRLSRGNFRFDVVGIDFSRNKPDITLIQNAFQVDS